MRTFLDWLNEISRWKASSWTPPPQDAMQRLKKYNKPGYYASFTRMPDKLGINPTPMDTSTPYGIYAYPVSYILQTHITEVPLGGEMPYIWVFKAKNPRRVQKIKSYGDKGWKSWNTGYEKSFHYSGGKDVTGIEMGKANRHFLDKNIHGFVDHGTGTIHDAEPTQAVFFGSHTIEPIELIRNNYVDKYIGAKYL